MTEGVNLNNFSVFINVVKDTKFHYPKFELRNAVGTVRGKAVRLSDRQLTAARVSCRASNP